MELNKIAKEFHDRAKAKGFWDNPREKGTLLMLIVSELSEALEADRNQRTADMEQFDYDVKRFPLTFNDAFEDNVKDTFEDEIADTFIRLFDLVGYLEIDIDKHIELKMRYNQGRKHKHGKAY